MNDLNKHYRSVMQTCETRPFGNRLQSLKQVLESVSQSVNDDELMDNYGTGELIESFEKEVAELLGKERAVFLPSGTMAQPIALKVWSEETRSSYIALPPTSHLELHEHHAYQALYQLNSVALGRTNHVPTLDDFKAAAHSPLAAALLELPMREIGGQLPSFDDLKVQSDWCKSNNIRLHMDGARLWQCAASYGKPFSEIADLFDSVYVSFYKDLGGIAGACLAGDSDFIDRCNVWIRRAGGNLFSLAPYVIAAREGFKQHLPQMPERLEKARWYAEQLNAFEHFKTWPRVPQTNMFRLRIEGDPTQTIPKMVSWMEAKNSALVAGPYDICEEHFMCELTIGDAFLDKTKDEWSALLEEFVEFVF